MAGLSRGLAPLRHHGFRLLAGGQLASNLGDAFYEVALPWYVLAEHGGALLLGTVLAAYGLPRTVLLAVGGHASDRWRPWTVMMCADSVRAAAAGALVAVAAAGPARAALLVPVAALLGAGEGLFLPSSFAVVPSLLPADELQAGNALTSGGTQLATLLGPAAGGLIVVVLGPVAAFAVDAASFVVSAATLAGLRAQRRAGAEEAPPSSGGSVEAPASLLSVLRSERLLQVVVVVTVAANLGFGGLEEVALPALVRGPFHTGAAGYGALLAAFGGGALLGTILAGQARQVRRPAVLASVVFAAGAALVAAVPYLGGTLAAVPVVLAFGFTNGFANVVTITAFQRWAPDRLMGRLMGLLMLASFGLFPVSVLLGGVVVHSFGPVPYFPVAGGILGLAVLGALTQRSWREFAPEQEEIATAEVAAVSP